MGRGGTGASLPQHSHGKGKGKKKPRGGPRSAMDQGTAGGGKVESSLAEIEQSGEVILGFGVEQVTGTAQLTLDCGADLGAGWGQHKGVQLRMVWGMLGAALGAWVKKHNGTF